jgi:hypothetical protein
MRDATARSRHFGNLPVLTSLPLRASVNEMRYEYGKEAKEANGEEATAGPLKSGMLRRQRRAASA